MNLRILKKLSKRAAPYLSLLGDDRQQFPAEKNDNYHECHVNDRTCWERGRLPHNPGDRMLSWPARDGKGWVYMRPPVHPLKGTIMVGATSGYYEPEWSEECAWAALKSLLFAEFTDWGLLAEWDDQKGPAPDASMRDLSTVSLIFKAADDLVAMRGNIAK